LTDGKESSLKHTISNYFREIKLVFTHRRSKLVALGIGIGYLVFYLIATGVLVFTANPLPAGIQISSQWPELLFRQRTPFNWEPIGLVSLGFVQIFLALPNIAFGVLIAVLVGVNIAVSAYTYSVRNVCRINPSSSVLAAAPALLTGVACCGPTLLISLGLASATVTVAFVSILPFLLPLALVGLVASLLWSGRKLNQAYTPTEPSLSVTISDPTS
jgi:hypothetical protein